MSRPRVIVVGSVNTDLVVVTERLPAPGETVSGGRFSRHGGGKGANAAVAAARLGAHVTMVGAVGGDPFGDEALELLEREGIETGAVARVDAPTGVALINVDAAGENQIAVASGANAEVGAGAVERAVRAAGPGVVLTNHEIPAAARLAAARAAQGPVVLNPAPARELADELLALGPILTPNAGEAAELTGEQEPEAAAAALAERTRAPVVVTLGARGALVLDGGVGHRLAGAGGDARRHHRRGRRVQRRARRGAGGGPGAARRGGGSRSRRRRSRRGPRAPARACRAATRSRVSARDGASARACLRWAPRSRVYAGWVEPRRLVVRDMRLALPRWPAALAGLRVGVLTDLHAGVLHAGEDAIARWVERMNAEAPDLVLLGGDFTDAHWLFGRRLSPERIAERLAALEAPLGRVAVLGNHDWKAFGLHMWTALAGAGIPVLENDAIAFDAPGGRLHVAGLADVRYRRPNVARALAGLPANEPVIALAHDPDVFPFVPARVALTVSGHTHGGQVAIPLRAQAVRALPPRRALRPRAHRRARPPSRRRRRARARAASPSACSRRPSCSCSSCTRRRGDDRAATADDPDQPLLREGPLGARAGRARVPRGAPRAGRQPDRVAARGRPRHAARADLRGGRARGVRGDPALRGRAPARRAPAVPRRRAGGDRALPRARRRARPRRAAADVRPHARRTRR